MLRYLQITVFASVILYMAKMLFIPLFFGLLIALILYPVCIRLEQKRFPRSLAIGICLLIVALLIACLTVLLVWQIQMFSQDAPALFEKLQAIWNTANIWIEDHFNLSIAHVLQESIGSVGSIIKSVVNDTLDLVFMLFLIPIFTALFLYHRRVFVQFLRLLVGENHQAKVDLILPMVISTYFNYVKGMILVYIIVGVLNSIGLLALGIEHAVLFGMLCAIMTIIPYVGIVISALLPISVAWLTKGSVWYPAGVIAVFAIVQYLEANVIFPKVVGVQLNVSTWAMLVAVIAGGILWGVSGMVLFIPFVALLKIGSDYVEEWKPLNILLSRSK
ncbi:MAG: AI-2E family transporter [Chitinophagaceae bacterium]|nr:AI-2E family transporter [Chitinophagaceae bacterium]